MIASGYTSYASCTQVGSTAISGTTVTKVYNVAITAAASGSVLIGLQLDVTATDGIWHLSNPWVFAPGNTIDRSNRYAVDDVLVAALTGPTGRGPANFRFMDSLNAPGGTCNYVDATDIMNPNAYSWLTQYTLPTVPPSSAGNTTRSGTATFQYARFLNTNVSSGRTRGRHPISTRHRRGRSAEQIRSVSIST